MPLTVQTNKFVKIWISCAGQKKIKKKRKKTGYKGIFHCCKYVLFLQIFIAYLLQVVGELRHWCQQRGSDSTESTTLNKMEVKENSTMSCKPQVHMALRGLSGWVLTYLRYRWSLHYIVVPRQLVILFQLSLQVLDQLQRERVPAYQTV